MAPIATTGSGFWFSSYKIQTSFQTGLYGRRRTLIFVLKAVNCLCVFVPGRRNGDTFFLDLL